MSVDENVRSIALKLVYRLRVRPAPHLWPIVPLIDQDAAIVFDSVVAGCARAAAHQDDAGPTAAAEVHHAL
jgi:hypothetical protein